MPSSLAATGSSSRPSPSRCGAPCGRVPRDRRPGASASASVRSCRGVSSGVSTRSTALVYSFIAEASIRIGEVLHDPAIPVEILRRARPAGDSAPLRRVPETEPHVTGKAHHAEGQARISGLECRTQLGEAYSDVSRAQLAVPWLVGDSTVAHPTADAWLNPAAFAIPQNADGTSRYGDLGRNTLLGPGHFNLDAGLTKGIRLGATRRLQIRWKVFNLTNHPSFGLPNAELGSADFGTAAAKEGSIGTCRSTHLASCDSGATASSPVPAVSDHSRPAAGVPAEWIESACARTPLPCRTERRPGCLSLVDDERDFARNIVFLGASAGGNLALAALMSLRDAGDLLPEAAVCLSPMIGRGLWVWRKERILRREDLPVISPPFRNVLQIRVNVPLGVCGPSGRRSREPRHDHRDIHDHQRGRKWTHPPNGGGRFRVSRRRPQFLMCLDNGVSPIRNAPGRIDQFSVWPICHPVSGPSLAFHVVANASANCSAERL